MVKVAYIKDPLTRKDIERFDFEAPVTLSEIIPSEGEYLVAVNGAQVSSYDMLIPDGTQIVYMPKLEKHAVDDVLSFAAAVLLAVYAPQIGGAIASTIGVSSTIGTALITAGVIVGGMTVINALMPTQLPSMGRMDADAFDTSPSYAWSGAVSISQIGRPIPVLYGRYITGGNVCLMEKSYSGDGEADSTEWLHIEQILCEGEVEPFGVQDIKINNIPAYQLKDAAIFRRFGTEDQPAFRIVSTELTFSDFPTILTGKFWPFQLAKKYDYQGYVQQIAVGSTVSSTQPVTVTTQSNYINQITVGLSLPHGLFYANDKGGLDVREVEFKIEYRVAGSSDVWTPVKDFRTDIIDWEYLYRCPDNNIWSWDGYSLTYAKTPPSASCEKVTTKLYGKEPKRPLYATQYFDTLKISAATVKPIKRQFVFDVTPGNRYEVRITKITPDQETSREQNVLNFDWLTEEFEVGLRHPHIAKLKLILRADDQLNGTVSSIKTALTRKQLAVYRPDGSFYGNVRSDNPAWAAWDIITNPRYGGGVSYSQIDFERFEEFAAWCDEEITFTYGSETYKQKRAVFNAIIDFRTDLWTLLQKIMGVGHAVPVKRGTKYSLIIDKPATPVQLFSMGNIVTGSFQTTYAGKEDVPDIIAVKYYDAENDYQPAIIEYTENPDGTKKQEVNGWGIVYAPQAWRYARYLWRTSKYIRRVVEFDVGIDALACEVGDVVMFAHDVPAWGHSGRLLGNNTVSVVNLDEPVEIDPAKTYTIIVRFTDDTIEQRNIDTSAYTEITTTTEITVTEAFSKAPEDYSVYTLGELNKEYKLLRIVNLNRTLEGNFHVMATDYREDILLEDEFIFPEQPISDLSLPSITSATVNEYLVKRQDGTIVSMVDLAWTVSTNTDYRVNLYYRQQGDEILNQLATGIGGNSYTFDAWFLEENKTYEFFIRPVFGGREIVVSNNPDITFQYLGKSAPPSDVPSISYEIDPQNGVVLLWDSVTDVDVAGYNIYINEELKFEKVSGNRLLVGFPSTVTMKYAVRAVDTTNHVSVNETSVSVTFTPPTLNTVTYKIVGDKIEISAADIVPGDFVIDKYVWEVDNVTLNETDQTIRITPTETQVDTTVTVYDVAGFSSTLSSNYVLDLANVTGVAVTPENGKLKVSVLGVDSSDFPVTSYTFSAGNQTITTEDSFALFSVNTAEDYTVSAYATDILGFSGTAYSKQYTVEAPVIDSVVWQVDDVYYVFTPMIIRKTFELDYIEIVNTTTNQRWTIEPNGEFKVAPQQNGDEVYTFTAYDKAGIASVEYSLTTTYSVPAITDVSYKFTGAKVLLSWNIVKGSFTVSHYNLHIDNSIVTVQGTTHTLDANWLSSKTITIVPVDVFGFEAGGTDIVITISAPDSPTLSGVVDDTILRLEWSKPVSTLDIDHYVLQYANTEIVTKSLSYSIPITWQSETFYIKAVDVAGNESDTVSFTHTVTLPETTQVEYQIIDNNVILKWSANEGSLPIQTFRIKRGDDLTTAETIGTKKGTFTVVFESIGGTYTYWVCPIDTAGNEGTCNSVTVSVGSPPDYHLNVNWVSDFSGIKTNVYYSESSQTIFAPINTVETYQEHFDNRGWASPQDQIDAGYPVWSQPYPASATYEEEFDYGTLLSSSMITVDVTLGSIVGGGVSLSFDIAISSDGENWTVYQNTQHVYATGFRWVKVTLHFNSTDDKSMVEVKKLTVRLDSKRKRDSGRATVSAADTNGTWVSFNEDFVDVESITLTPQGTANLTAVYDFDDVPNPTGFWIYLFDENGNRVDGTVSWSAVGY